MDAIHLTSTNDQSSESWPEKLYANAPLEEETK